MRTRLEYVEPSQIETRSFEILASELPHPLDPELAPIIMRVVHTSADFDYVDNLYFTPDVVARAQSALLEGACIVTDTNMALSGINKGALAKLGCEATCFMADPDIARRAEADGTTRAQVSMDKAAELDKPLIFAIGNAPTALIRLYDLIQAHGLSPKLVIAAPVGFVNVEHSKELIMQADADLPLIVARGRKGGSTIAAAICNALMYETVKDVSRRNGHLARDPGQGSKTDPRGGSSC